MHDLDYYNTIACSLFYQDEERDALYARIDDAAAAKADIPQALRDLEWIGERNFATTAASDALNAATRTFAARLPDISIDPVYDTQDEYELTDRMETAISWEFQRMNASGKKSVHWKVVESAVKYCAVAILVECLPLIYAKAEKSKKVEAILRGKSYNWKVYNPATVHSQESNDIVERVLVAYTRTAQSLLDEYGFEHPGIQKMLLTMGADDPDSLQNTEYCFYDYWDWEYRCIWILETHDSVMNREPSGGIELVNEEHNKPFLPWVIVDNEEPILKTFVNSGLYDNLNVLRTIQFSKAIDQAAHPEYWIATPDGTLRGVSIHNQNPNQPLVTNSQTQVQQLRPPMLDPQLAQLESMAESEAFRSTVAQILASVEKYASTQNFSVVNAMINAALSQLALSQMAIERAEAKAFFHIFEYVDETEFPLVGYSRGEKGKNKGEEMAVKSGDFDLKYLYINVKLNPNTITDEQMKINNSVTMIERLGVSKEVAYDNMGLKNWKLNVAKKTEEVLYDAHIAAEAAAIQQARLLQVQPPQQPQAQPNPENMASQMASPSFESMQGVDTRGGGASTSMPGMGREQING